MLGRLGGRRVRARSTTEDLRVLAAKDRSQSAVLLVKMIGQPLAAKDDPARYLRAFDFLQGPEKDAALLELAFNTPPTPYAAQATLISTEAVRRLKSVDLKANPKYATALADLLKRSPGTPQFVELVDKFSVKEKYADLLALAQQNPDQQLGIDAARVLLTKNELALLNCSRDHARPANGLAFRLKLLLAAGVVPQLGACSTCGAREDLHGFSAAAGGIVCGSCQGSGFPLEEESYRFLVTALGAPLAEAPDASERVLRQVERALAEQAEHHAQVRLRPLGPGVSPSSRNAPVAPAAVRIDGDGLSSS